MKKLFDSKFLIISALSIVTLILLIVFSFFLFNRDEAQFVKSGYIINPLSSISEKYFFEKGTSYRENLSSMVVFNDVDAKEVKVLRDSFVHYEDGSISLLKNGAILDVDSIHDNLALFYNISNNSVIEKGNNGYYIETLNGNINLKNFIVRISDNKYLVVGDVKLSYNGSSSLIDGDYFEIVYVEEGIVNIENKNFKYELSAEGSVITVGNYTIDLGTKVLSYRDNDVMSITAITIDGNENVEIIPKKEESKSGSSSSSTNGGGNGGNNGNAPGSASGNNDNSSSEGTSGNGNDGESDIKRNDSLRISLKEANVGPTNIDVVFDIENNDDNSTFMLQVVNALTGNTVDITAQVLEEVPISVNLLTPSTKYLFTVVDSETKVQYFQRILETDSMGIRFYKSSVTSNSIEYAFDVSNSTRISNATLTLYKFDEELGKNVDIGKSKIIDESYWKDSEENVFYVNFNDLDSDTIYTAVLDNFSLENVNFNDVYSTSLSTLTLKETPTFPTEGEDLMSVIEGSKPNEFKLYVGKISDPDNAILKYTYYIYDTKNTESTLDDELAMEKIVKSDASPIVVNFNNLTEETNYYYRVVIEYFDNEKYIEYQTIDSAYFIKREDSNPTITVIPDYDYVTYNQIAAKIYINDNACKIKLPDRPGFNCSGDNVTKIIISRINKSSGERENVREINANFAYDNNSIYYSLLVDNLEENTTYYINVYTYYDSDELDRIPHSSDSIKTITTKKLASFEAKWTNPDGSKQHPIKVNLHFDGTETDNSMSVNASAAILSRVVLRLYDGDVSENIDNVNPITSKEIIGNIKSLFVDNQFVITNDETFNLSYDDLKSLNSDNKISKQYTLMVQVYYGQGRYNQINLTGGEIYLYKVPITVNDDDIPEPQLFIDEIKNGQVSNLFSKLSSNTVIGYRIQALFANNDSFPVKNFIFKVYDINNNPVNFYIKKNDGSIDFSNPVSYIKYSDIERSDEDFEIYVTYGIDYDDSDNIMRRGNQYKIGYYLEVYDSELDDIIKYPRAVSEDSPYEFGIYESVSLYKESPTLKMYISSSDINSVTYRYYVMDMDNAIYKENNNYYLYSLINENALRSIPLEVDEHLVEKFFGNFTINNLSRNDIYSFYYKLALLKTNNPGNDITSLNDNKIKDFKFDGKFDVNDNDYNFKYKVINQPSANRVAIAILADDEFLSNILDYEFTFIDSKQVNSPYIIRTSKLVECEGVDNISSGSRCLFVDYVDLKEHGMKSNIAQNQIHNITVNVSATYDTAITGYDVGVSSYGNNSTDYIFRQISRKDISSKYIVLDSNANIVEWNRTENLLAGRYKYIKNNVSSLGAIKSIDLKNVVTNKEVKNINLFLTNYGYVRNSEDESEAINPRVMSSGDLVGIDNVFSFSSITPKASPTTVIPFLSGAGINLKTNGIDTSDLVKQDNQYKLYIEVWGNPNDVGDLNKVARPRVEIPLEDNYNELSVAITGLHSYDDVNHPAYYYQIYAMMYVNGQEVYVQLNDADSIGNVKKTYSFVPRGASNFLQSDSIELNTLIPDSDSNNALDYGERYLTTKFNLIPYSNSFDLDYNIEYYLRYNVNTCDVDSYVLHSEIPSDKMSTSIVDTLNVYSNNNLIYGTNYRICTYAKYPVYEKNNNGEFVTSYERVRLLESNQNGYIRSIRNLIEPNFVVTREAKYENNLYALDYRIVVNDPDKVLYNSSGENNGIVPYYVKMTNNGQLVGRLYERDDTGYIEVNVSGYDNYSLYPLNADDINKYIRITGSDMIANTEYYFQVCGVAYVNNIDSLNNNIHDVCYNVSVYTSNENNVAFGSITYTVTEKSIVATFLGGSNLVNNINKLEYTVIDKTDNVEYNSPNDGYVIGDNEGHYFRYTEGNEWALTLIDNMENINGHRYIITMRLYDKDGRLYADLPIGDQVYYKDSDK